MPCVKRGSSPVLTAFNGWEQTEKVPKTNKSAAVASKFFPQGICVPMNALKPRGGGGLGVMRSLSSKFRTFIHTFYDLTLWMVHPHCTVECRGEWFAAGLVLESYLVDACVASKGDTLGHRIGHCGKTIN
jgi:hypothetical protein